MKTFIYIALSVIISMSSSFAVAAKAAGTNSLSSGAVTGSIQNAGGLLSDNEGSSNGASLSQVGGSEDGYSGDQNNSYYNNAANNNSESMGGENNSNEGTSTEQIKGSESGDLGESLGTTTRERTREAENNQERIGTTTMQRESENLNAGESATGTEATSSEDRGQESGNNGEGEQHRSEVANVVQALNKIAGKDSGIGSEVSAIAQQEASTSQSVADRISTIENRNGLMTFLIGSDYKNLGALRSELVTTSNSIDRLTSALDKTSSTTKADLQSQINSLKDIQAKTESFINQQENKFSLFGWLVKMFNQ
jgi:hypothetical protein